MRMVLFIAALCAVVMIGAGCASTDPYAESSIPWNSPQSWEGSPGIPGFDGR